MKKSILAAGISLLFVFLGAAAEPTTLNGRMERVEDVLYGGNAQRLPYRTDYFR